MNKTNLIIDIGLLLSFLVAMAPGFSGISIHEWFSLAFAAAILIHLLCHWDWIIHVGSKFFTKLWHTSRLKFLIDIFLFVTFIAVMLSGLMISKSILPALGIQTNQNNTWRTLHSASADFVVLLTGLHFALNWEWVICMVKRHITTPLTHWLLPNKAAQTTTPRSEKGEIKAN